MSDPTAIAVSDADDRLIDLWLHGRSRQTQGSYRTDVGCFRRFVDKPLGAVTLADLQAFADSLGALAPATQARRLSAIKSLLSFGHRLGLLPVNAGAALRLPGRKNRLAEKIISEGDTHRMIALEPNERNRVLLKLLYAAGARVSEICALKWRDVQAREEGGQITVYGKGGQTRAIVLPSGVFHELEGLRGVAGPDNPVFVSRTQGGHLDRSQVLRIVRAGAVRAGIAGDVSPHWLRHAHASHALDRGAPIHLVQATLGHASVATTGKYLHARPTESSAKYLAL